MTVHMAAVRRQQPFHARMDTSASSFGHTLLLQVVDLTRQQEITKQQEAKQKEAEFKAQAAQFSKVRHGVSHIMLYKGPEIQ